MIYYNDEYGIKMRRERDTALARVKELEDENRKWASAIGKKHNQYEETWAEMTKLRQRMKRLEQWAEYLKEGWNRSYKRVEELEDRLEDRRRHGVDYLRKQIDGLQADLNKLKSDRAWHYWAEEVNKQKARVKELEGFICKACADVEAQNKSLLELIKGMPPGKVAWQGSFTRYMKKLSLPS